MIAKKTFLAILLVLVITNTESKLSVECIVDFLKFRHFDSDYFSAVKNFLGNPSDCSNDVKSAVENFYNETLTRFSNHLILKAYAECVVKTVQNDIYENHRLAALAAELKGVGLKFWKSSEKNRFIEEHKKKSKEIEDSALISCQGTKQYGEFFDSYLSQKKNEELSYNVEYCMRKHLLNQNAISSGQYGFTINPKAISTQTIQCEDIMKTKLNEMQTQILRDGAENCTANVFFSNGYLDEIMKIQILSKLNMASSEKETEKQKFIARMISLTQNIKSCST